MRYYIRLAIIFPIAVMAISFGIQQLLPGCVVDEGAGASSQCGMIGPFLSISRFGGFMWLTLGVFGLLPAALVTALSTRNDENTHAVLKVLESEARKSQDMDSPGTEHNGGS